MNSSLLDAGTGSVSPLAQPLIQRNPDATDDDNIEECPIGRTAYLGVIAAAVGGLMFGYDTGVISGVLVAVQKDLGGEFLSTGQKELVTAITSFGALLGSSLSGIIFSNSVGRKLVICFCCLLFLLATVVMSVSSSVAVFAIGRLLVGLAIGGASMVVPVFIAEIAPARLRGTMIAMNALATTGGQLLAYIAGSALQNIVSGWRLMIALGAIFPIGFLLVMPFVPESPRFSVLVRDLEAAQRSLLRLYPQASIGQVKRHIQTIEADIIAQTDGMAFVNPLASGNEWSILRKMRDLLSIPSTRRAFIVACSLMAFQQLCGFNSFMYYSASIFSLLGFSDAVTVSIVVSLFNFLFTFVAVFGVDRIGRRQLLLRTVWLLSASLLLASIASLFTQQSTPSFDAGGTSQPGAEKSTVGVATYMIVVCILVFVAGYASALGTIPWHAIEFMPLKARILGSTMMSTTNWLTNIFVSSTYLSLLANFGPSVTFLMYAVICFLGYMMIYFWYPEVKGLPLELIPKCFENGFGFRHAELVRMEYEGSKNLKSDDDPRGG